MHYLIPLMHTVSHFFKDVKLRRCSEIHGSPGGSGSNAALAPVNSDINGQDPITIRLPGVRSRFASMARSQWCAVGRFGAPPGPAGVVDRGLYGLDRRARFD